MSNIYDEATIKAAAGLVDNGDGLGYVHQDCWPIDFVEIKVGNNPVSRLSNHFHTFSLPSDFASGNHNFVAAATLLSFSNISDELEAKDNALDISLSGIDQEIIALTLGSPVEGSKIYVKRGFYNQTLGELVSDPIDRWAGRVSSFSITDDYRFSEEDSIAVSLSCKSLLVTLLSRVSGRFTSQAGFTQHLQSYDQPLTEDKSMEFVTSLANFSPDFGKGVDQPAPRGGGGKIVCTAMNEQYGFGSFRNAIWINYAKKNLTEYHEKGYHILFKPWVNVMYKNAWYSPFLTKWGEGIARRRSADIFAEMKGRNKRSIRARIERAILEPLCYIIGRLSK
jgi:hypothetical protein